MAGYQQRFQPHRRCAFFAPLLAAFCFSASFSFCTSTSTNTSTSSAQQCQSGGGTIIDITVPVKAGLPMWEQTAGLPRHWRSLSQSQAEGDVVSQSHLNLDAHTGTHIVSRRSVWVRNMFCACSAAAGHQCTCLLGSTANCLSRPTPQKAHKAHPQQSNPRPPPHRPNPTVRPPNQKDAPAHFLPDGAGIDALPLSALVGRALVIDVAADTNITAALLKQLAPPLDAERLLFRTLNTRRGLLGRTAFASDYVGLDSSAARWLAEERPGVVLVGIDYLSIGALYDIVETHKTLFRTVGGLCVYGGEVLRSLLSVGVVGVGGGCGQPR